MLRPATYSTENPPVQIDNIELAEYVKSLRRRIEVQNDLLEALAKEVKKHRDEVEKLALDLGIKDGGPGVGWTPVNKTNSP
jgi:transcriptional accessory protein Tex/SPT6